MAGRQSPRRFVGRSDDLGGQIRKAAVLRRRADHARQADGRELDDRAERLPSGRHESGGRQHRESGATGDRVDVMAYFNKSELIPRSMTKTVLMGVRVYALDGDTERKAADEETETGPQYSADDPRERCRCLDLRQ